MHQMSFCEDGQELHGRIHCCNYIFSFQVDLARRQRSDHFGLRVNLPPSHLSATYAGDLAVSIFVAVR